MRFKSCLPGEEKHVHPAFTPIHTNGTVITRIDDAARLEPECNIQLPPPPQYMHPSLATRMLPRPGSSNVVAVSVLRRSLLERPLSLSMAVCA